jgi:hypothetical protein
VDWTSVVEIAVGVLAGGMISAYFARRGSQELKREAESLRHLTTLILRGLEEAGFVEFSRDEQGGLIGIAFKRPVSDVLGVGDGVEVKLETETEDRPAPEEPRT